MGRGDKVSLVDGRVNSKRKRSSGHDETVVSTHCCTNVQGVERNKPLKRQEACHHAISDKTEKNVLSEQRADTRFAFEGDLVVVPLLVYAELSIAQSSPSTSPKKGDRNTTPWEQHARCPAS